MFDCHIHTKFSVDSTMDVHEACKEALKQGLSGVAFTDHLDIDYPDSDESWNIDFNQYYSEISAAKAYYEGKLTVLRAIEMGIQPHVIDESLEIVKSVPFDYVLASVHVIDKIDPYARFYYKDKTKQDAYERYLKEIYFMINNINNFDMVGHFEYITRYSSYVDRSIRYADHTDVFDSILKTLISQGRGFEINTGSFRNPMVQAEYDVSVLKRYHELGGDMVCLGSDAHKAEHIGLRFDYFAQIIRDAGFKYTVHFENRKPIYDKL